jgi:hypothetical protein
MFLWFIKGIHNFYSPEESGGAGSGPMGHEDMVDFLKDDDDKETIPLEEPKSDKTGKDKPGKTPEDKTKSEETTEEITEEDSDEESTEEVDELEELERELKEPTDEELEIVTPVRRREILAKYPNLFKEFPALEKSYYRDQQFSEILPTIADAKIAVEKSQTLDRFENELIGGNTENILKAVKEENQSGFNKLVDDYLPTLAKVDEKAFHHVVGNVIKHTIMNMVQESNRSGNEPLKMAAQLVNQFVFGSSDFVAPVKLSKENPQDKQQEDAVNKKEQEFTKRQFTSAHTDLNTRVNNVLKNTIEANIDPKTSMSEFVRKHATNDAIEVLENLISKDTRFRSLVDKMWEKAFESNFSKESVDRIKSAYISKARTLLPSVIKKARNDALKGMGRRAKTDDNIEESTPKKGPIPPGRPRSQQPSGKITKASDIPKGMRSIDFLMQD